MILDLASVAIRCCVHPWSARPVMTDTSTQTMSRYTLGFVNYFRSAQCICDHQVLVEVIIRELVNLPVIDGRVQTVFTFEGGAADNAAPLREM